MSFQSLVATVSSLSAQPYEGLAFRHVSSGSDPLSGVGARIHGGRWNPPDSYSTLYLGLEEATVMAEWSRLAQRQGLTPDDFLPRDLVSVVIRLEAVVDLRSTGVRDALGLSDAVLRGFDQRRCQQVGEAAHHTGAEAIIAPSSTGVGAVAAVFLDQLRADSALEVVDSKRLLAFPRDTR